MGIWRDVQWGMKWGLVGGAFYSLLAVVVYALKGSENAPVSFGVLLVVYFGGGLVGGALTGLLQPLVVHRLGAAVVGVVAFVPVILGFLVLISGPPSNWGGGELFSLAVTSIFVGGYAGYNAWDHREVEDPAEAVRKPAKRKRRT